MTSTLDPRRTDAQLPSRVATVLAGGNEMGQLMRAHDWSSSPVGPVESWPQSLRTALNILLDSRYPMYIAWGPAFTQFYNDGYRPILGATKHPAALGRSTRETFAEIWDFIGPMFEQVMRSGQPTYLEDQILPMDRYGYVEECYFTFCYSAIRTESGEVGGVFVTVVETTSRVLGERRMRTLRDLGANSARAQDVATALTLATDVLDGNPTDIPFSLIYAIEPPGEARLIARTGLAAEHVAALPRLRLDPPSDAAWPLRDAIAGARTIDDVERRFGVVSSRAWPEHVRAATIVPIQRPGQEGELEAMLVVGLNPRLSFDDDYRGFITLVAGQLGAAIAAARSYEEERQRAHALAELDRAKTTFFSNVSHEFRTPLTLMLGPIEDLLRHPAQPLAPADRAKLELLQRNGLRLLKLVNMLLDFARIEAGRVRASFEPVDLVRATADLASAFRSAIERAGMRLVVTCEPIGEPVFVDVAMWEKIVLNLLSNAFKFTFDGEIRVSLAADGRRRCARLVIADTGVGIPADELPHVFERFRRIEGTRARTHEGSGIGLALVQELVRLHGGTVRVTSEPNRGTTFTVEVPLGTAHLGSGELTDARPTASTALGATPYVEEALRWLPHADATETTEALGAERTVSDGEQPAPFAEVAGARVLVVDDNADMRGYLARLLRSRYEVDLATNGAEALEVAARHRPDLVVSDVMMPVLDGFGLIRALKANAATAAIPVILLSARAGEESTIEGLGSGADDYLVKPFSARELMARVRAHLVLGRALKSERARLVAMFEQSPSFLAVLRGPELVFEYANSSYRKLVGGRDIVGKPVLAALPEVAEQGYGDLLRQVYQTGIPYIGREAPVVLARASEAGEQHETVYVDFLYQPIVEPDGRISGIVAHGADVSAQVRARQELEQLYHSVKEANEAKRQFLAAMSHELRTPLNAVLGYADLLALGVRGSVSEAQRADIERIRTASQYLLTLINDILNFSKVEAGQLELRPALLSVNEVLAGAHELVLPHIEDQGIHFALDAAAPGLTVHADSERLQQILLNLLMNASKFTPKGGRIHVWAEADGAMVRLHVDDTGRGIAESQLERIFEPFVQLDRAINRASQQGVGLGLAISRDLARRMGGDVVAESRAGRGSRFTVVLPRDSITPDLVTTRES